MSLYAIGDLHLSLGTDKPMDVFGGRWENYVEKIKEGFSVLNDDDLTVICGDISWGMSMDETLEDFKFIDRLPGKKIILKGNHDYWWTTTTKAKSLPSTISRQSIFCTITALNMKISHFAAHEAGFTRRARATSMTKRS